MLERRGDFPRFTWLRCECGCGYEGEDEVWQFMIEEALMYRLDLENAAAKRQAAEDAAVAEAERRTREQLERLRRGKA